MHGCLQPPRKHKEGRCGDVKRGGDHAKIDEEDTNQMSTTEDEDVMAAMDEVKAALCHLSPLLHCLCQPRLTVSVLAAHLVAGCRPLICIILLHIAEGLPGSERVTAALLTIYYVCGTSWYMVICAAV